jgi:ribosomal protein S27AE
MRATLIYGAPPFLRGAVAGSSRRARERTCQPSRMGREIEDAARPCPMCGATTWIVLDGMSTLQALEGGLQALAFSCDRCGFIRWHRKDKVDAIAEAS